MFPNLTELIHFQNAGLRTILPMFGSSSPPHTEPCKNTHWWQQNMSWMSFQTTKGINKNMPPPTKELSCNKAFLPRRLNIVNRSRLLAKRATAALERSLLFGSKIKPDMMLRGSVVRMRCGFSMSGTLHSFIVLDPATTSNENRWRAKGALSYAFVRSFRITSLAYFIYTVQFSF